jgi:hypothetical protein
MIITLLRRFWLPIVALPLLVGALSLASGLSRPARYQASARLMISQESFNQAGAGDQPDLDINYSWNSSTYILDDLPQVVNSALFAADVRSFLASEGREIDAAAIQGGLRAEVLHRSVFLAATADDPETALAIVRGGVYALQSNGLKYWSRSSPTTTGINLAVLDPPGGVTELGSLRALATEVALRAGLALGAALGLALLLSYLDDRLRSPAQAEAWTGAQVIGMIPEDR